MWWTVQDSNRAALTTPVGRVSNQPSGLLLSPRFPTRRNVYQERCRPFGLGIFCGGRYRARTATTTTAACGRNREELLGQRSDFSRPRQGAEEKSANATRKAAHSAVSKATVRLCLARGSQRVGMSTGMTTVWWWTAQDCKGRIFSAIAVHASTGILTFGLMESGYPESKRDRSLQKAETCLFCISVRYSAE